MIEGIGFQFQTERGVELFYAKEDFSRAEIENRCAARRPHPIYPDFRAWDFWDRGNHWAILFLKT